MDNPPKLSGTLEASPQLREHYFFLFFFCIFYYFLPFFFALSLGFPHCGIFDQHPPSVFFCSLAKNTQKQSPFLQKKSPFFQKTTSLNLSFWNRGSLWVPKHKFLRKNVRNPCHIFKGFEKSVLLSSLGCKRRNRFFLPLIFYFCFPARSSR